MRGRAKFQREHVGPRYVAYVDVHRRTAHRPIEPIHGAPTFAVDERINKTIRAGRGRMVDLAVAEWPVYVAGVERRDVDVGVLLDEVAHSEVREGLGDAVYVETRCTWFECVFPLQEAARCCCAR